MGKFVTHKMTKYFFLKDIVFAMKSPILWNFMQGKTCTFVCKFNFTQKRHCFLVTKQTSLLHFKSLSTQPGRKLWNVQLWFGPPSVEFICLFAYKKPTTQGFVRTTHWPMPTILCSTYRLLQPHQCFCCCPQPWNREWKKWQSQPGCSSHNCRGRQSGHPWWESQ